MSDWRVAPVFCRQESGDVDSVLPGSAEFPVIGTFGTPVEMAFVGTHGVQIMLQDAEGKPTPGPNSKYKSVAWDELFRVDDVRSLHRELSEADADIRKEPYVTFYGRLEIEVRDPDGHVLCFSQAADRSNG